MNRTTQRALPYRQTLHAHGRNTASPLYTLLAELYPDQASAVRIAQSAGIRTELVPLTNQALNNWHAILQEAERQDRLAQLLAVVEEEYGENPRWRAIALQVAGWPALFAELAVAGQRIKRWTRWHRGIVFGLLLMTGLAMGLVMTQLNGAIPLATATPPPTPTATPQPTPAPFTYNVTVRDAQTNQSLPDAQVQIAVEGKAPLTEYADSNGVARLFIPAAFAERPGRLTVVAEGYAVAVYNLDLWPDQLPTEVRLLQE